MSFFDSPRSLNDINVLGGSSVFQELYEDWTPKYEYVFNGHEYSIEYFLSNGIYPKWVTFVKIISFP